MLVKEKPTILQTLWQRLQETLQTKLFNSRTMEPRLVKYTVPIRPVMEQQ